MSLADNSPMEGATGSKTREGVIQWSVPYYCATDASVLDAGGESYQGCNEVSRTWTCLNNNNPPAYMVTVVYEGGATGAQSTFLNEDAVWSVDCELREAPIISHWNFAAIQKEYGGQWDDDRTKDNWVFPEKLPEGSSAQSGTSKSAGGAGVTNPLFGTTTYLVLATTMSVTYTTTTVSGIFSNIGKSYNAVPNAPSSMNSVAGGEKNWMKLAPQATKRGNTWTVTESYLLSEHRRWPKEVYNEGGID